MNKILAKIYDNIKLINCPVLIHGFVYYQNNGVRPENWGDDINYYFLREIIQRPILIYNRISFAMRFKLKNYLVIGSTIDMLCVKNTEIWGAGIIDGSKSLKNSPSKVHAVRGPLTRKRLLEMGIACPEVYGDPALLIPLFYQPKHIKQYRYGFIPHRSNLDELTSLTVDGMPLADREDVLVIDLSKYDSWTDIIDQVCSCRNILSASLHGLVVAEAYGIPNIWIEFGKPLIGGHFKFHDFFLSIGRDREASFVIKNDGLSTSEILRELESWQLGNIDLQPLIDAAPFRIKL